MNMNDIDKGEFIIVSGSTGSGKTSFLRNVYEDLSNDKKVYYIFSNPNEKIIFTSPYNQILYTMGQNSDILYEAAEIFSFLGIENLFDKNVNEMSEGEKQLINIAIAILNDPDILILDTPFSYIDPFYRDRIISILEKINKELFISIIISEHDLNGLLELSNRLILIEKYNVIIDAEVRNVVTFLRNSQPELLNLFPDYIKLYIELDGGKEYPLNVKEAAAWFDKVSLSVRDPMRKSIKSNEEIVIRIKNLSFSYGNDYVLKDINMKILKGSSNCIIGSNGAGKTTLIKLISGLIKSYQGHIFLNDRNMKKYNNLYHDCIALLPSNPKYLFVKERLEDDIKYMIDIHVKDKKDKEKVFENIISEYDIKDLMNRTFDNLSFGQKQLAAIAKVMISNPKILILDEPTKGLDYFCKEKLSYIINHLKSKGITLVMVSHDMDFIAQNTDYCYFLFNHAIAFEGETNKFIINNKFYTTNIHNIVKKRLPNTINLKDIVDKWKPLC